MREGREIGVRISVRKETPIAKKSQVFLKNSEIKTKLFKILAIRITEIPANTVEIHGNSFGRSYLKQLGC